MSWGEIKKALNKDPNKSLDTLVKEQFEKNFGSSGNVSYIKNTQLGTNLNNLLNGSSSDNIDFNNKPLVDKINYLLLNTDSIRYDTSNSAIIKSYLAEKRTRGGLGTGEENIEIVSYTFFHSGNIKISVDIKKDNYYADGDSYGGISISKNSESTKSSIIKISGQKHMDYTTKTVILNVNKGDNITFYLQGSSTGAFYCKNFKILGEIVFKNPYKK